MRTALLPSGGHGASRHAPAWSVHITSSLTSQRGSNAVNGTRRRYCQMNPYGGNAWRRAAALTVMAEIQRVALSRDQQAFRTLFLTFGPKVKAMMMRHGADVETAEEIAQETMLAVWRKAHLFVESKGSVATWIFTIARNLRIDRIRRQVVWQAYGEEFAEMPGSEEPLEDRMAREQAEGIILQALDTLPPEQREVIQLAFAGDLSHSEIAQKLGLPLGTVKSRVRLAYQKLRETVEDAL